MTDRELISAAIKATGLSVREFSADIGRDWRSVFRWLAGKTDAKTGVVPPMPKAVRAKCEAILAETLNNPRQR